MDAAQTVEEALAVSKELTTVEAEIEQVKGRMQYLRGRAALSTIRVDLEVEEAIPLTADWSLGVTLRQAARAQTVLFRTLIEALVWLIVVPGPAVVYVLTQSVAHGRRAGLASVAGIAAGAVVHVVAAAIGLSSLLVSSAIAFNVVNTSNRLVYTIGDTLYRITEPALRPIRRLMPNLGGIDLSPLVLLLVIYFLRSLLIEYWPR